MSFWQMLVVTMVLSAVAGFLSARLQERASKKRLMAMYRESTRAMEESAAAAVSPYAAIVPAKPKRKPRSDKGKRRKKRPGRREVDITGQRFGLLVAVRRDGTIYKSKQPAWIFQCDCGNVIRAGKSGIAYPSSEQVSCGCWKRESDAYNAAKASAASAAKRKEMR